MTAIDTVKQSILTECEEDHVGLLSVVREVEEAFPKRSEKAVRELVLRLLYELLTAQQIRAGFPTAEGRFLVVLASPETILAQIKVDWPVGHNPNVGEGFWFTKVDRPDPLSDLVETVKNDKDKGNYPVKIDPKKYGFSSEAEYWRRIRELAGMPEPKES